MSVVLMPRRVSGMWAASHEPRQVTSITPTVKPPHPPPGSSPVGGVPREFLLASPRPYVAAAAASVLAALYFVPSASAAPDHAASSAASQQRTAATARSGHTPGLADTGAVNTKPYVVGGAVFLVAGAGLIVD